MANLTFDYTKVSYNFAEMLAKRGLPAHDMTADTLKELGLAPVLDFYSPVAAPGKKSPREMNTQSLISAYNIGYAKGDLSSFFQTLALFSRDFSPKKETSAFQTYVNGKLPIKDTVDGTFTTFAGKFDAMSGILKLVEKGKVTPSIVTQLFAEVAYSADRFRKTEYSREYMTKAQGSLLSSFAVPEGELPDDTPAENIPALKLGVKPEMYKALKAVLPETQIPAYIAALRGKCDLSAARDVKPGAKDTPFEMKTAHPTAFTDGDMSRIEIAAKTATSVLYLPQVQAAIKGNTLFDFGAVEIDLQSEIKALYNLQPNDTQETITQRIKDMASTLQSVVAGVPEADRPALLDKLTEQAATHGLFAAKTADEFCYGLGELVLRNPTILPESVRNMGAMSYDRTQLLEQKEDGSFAFRKPKEDGTYDISVDGKIFYNGTIITIPNGVPASVATVDAGAGDGSVKLGPAKSNLDQASFDAIVDQLIRESKLPPYAKNELKMEDIAVLETGSNPVMTAITQHFQDAAQTRTAGFDQEASEGSMSAPGGASRHDGLSSFDVSLYRSTTYYKNQKIEFSNTIARYGLLNDYTFIPGADFTPPASDAARLPEAATTYDPTAGAAAPTE